MTKPGFEKRSETSSLIDSAALVTYTPEQVQEVKQALDLERDPTPEELADFFADVSST
ncbi:hypothetical protein ACIBSW_34555 [Actinoplanes sp. NPDC049668]|uniref:hypothetical protein n=1 Tax=unclassified Actinoplanes TaxID=2626549 RepID=UPI0033A82EFD